MPSTSKKNTKKKKILNQIHSVNHSKEVYTRQFMSSNELFDLFCQTKLNDDEEMSQKSFMTHINYALKYNLCLNLKRKIERNRDDRKVTYIIVPDREKDVDVHDIKIYITRSKRAR